MNNRKSIQEKSVSLQNEISKMSDRLSSEVSESENELLRKFRRSIQEGVASIKDNLAKLTADVTDNDELQEKLDKLRINFVQNIVYGEKMEISKKWGEFQEDVNTRMNTHREEITGLNNDLETLETKVKEHDTKDKEFKSRINKDALN